MVKYLWAALLVAAIAAAGLAQAPAARHPSSPEEGAALKSLSSLFNDPNTPPSQFKSAVADFRSEFPSSSYMLAVLVLGVRYSNAHSDYPAMLDFGLAALAIDPHDLYTLSVLGSAIPENVKDSDLDRELRLQQGAGFDQQVISTVDAWLITANGFEYGGIHYNQTQATTLRNNLGSAAYLSLGRTNALLQKYPDAVAAYQQALKYQTQPTAKAQTYYDMAIAQADAGQPAAALAALDKAKPLAAGSDFLLRAIQLEEDKLKADGS